MQASPLRLGLAALLAAAVGITGAMPAGAAPSSGDEVAADIATTAGEQAKAAVAKGVDKGPGPKGPAAAPYPKQQSLLDKAAAVRQDGPKIGTPEAKPVEVVDARTRTSRTLQNPLTGQMQTEVSSTSLNYRDAGGDWQPIDTRLKAAPKTSTGAPGGWVNGDNRFDATFPSSLAEGPVAITDADDKTRSVSLQLLAPSTISASSSAPAASAATTSAAAVATATASTSTATAAASTAAIAKTPGAVEGSEVTYPDAAGKGLDVAYEAGTDEVKETITLDTAAAASALAATGGTVSFALSVGKGLTPTLTDTTPKAAGGEQINVVDAKGATAFMIPPAFMDDAKGAHSDAVSYTLTGDAEAGWTLTLTPDAAWLAAPERAFPVVVDPTISYPSPILACSIRSSAPSTSGCGGADLPLSWDTSGVQQRVLLRFEDLLNIIPADALVEQAAINLKVSADTGAVASSVDVREATSAWNSAATWNTRNGSTAWSSAGGDRAGLVSARTTLTPDGSVQRLQVGELVQRWLEGTNPHNGFVLEKTAATSGGHQVRVGGTSNAIGPALEVQWLPRTGLRKGNTTVVEQQLTDRTTVQVNPATGNAVVSTTEYDITGVGLDFQLAHTSNSLTTAGFGVHGYGWTTSAGGAGGVRLEVTDQSVKYMNGTGAVHIFHKAVDGSYTRPMGLDADLATTSGGIWTLTDRKSKTVQTFIPIGAATAGLSEIKDRNGNKITFTYDSSATHPWSGTRILRSITDTRGRVLQVSNPGYWNTSATDAANRSVFYNNSSEQLNALTDTAGGQVRYTYDAAHRVSAITTPEGNRLLLSYDSAGRTTRLVRVTNMSNDTGRTWEFTYAPFSRSSGAPATTTAVKDPNGHTTTYTSDGRGLVSKVVDARGKIRSTTYSPNDDVASNTAATASTSGGGGATSTVTFNTGTFTVSSARTPTGAGTAYTYGTGARLYDVATETNARGTATSYSYDGAGNQTTVTTGGTTTTNLYQGGTDPAYGGTINCGPTVNGAVTATKAGVLCEERDALYAQGSTAAGTTAHRTAYRYDTVGQLVTLIPAGTAADGTTSTSRGVQTYGYDSLSRLTSLKDGNGKTTTYDYDALDRLVYVRHHDGTVESSYITGDGPLRSVTEYTAAGAQSRYTQYSRDNQNQLQDINAPEGFIDLTYDPLGLLTEYTDTGGTVKYRYNDADQLTSIAEPGSDCAGRSYDSPGDASAKCILFRVDDDGRRTGVRYPGGSTQTWNLDDTGRTTRTVGTAAGDNKLDLNYTYTDTSAPATTTNPTKDTGLVTSITDPVAGRKTTYSHDSLDRLTVADATAIGGISTVDYEAFCYDAAGNRTKYYTAPGATCSTANPAISATFDGANQMTGATGLGPTGNLTGTGFSYDGNGNQTAAKSTPGRATAYNDRDQAVTTAPAGASAITATYAGTGNLNRLTAGSDSFQSTPLSPAPGRYATSTTTTWTIRDPEGALISLRQGPTTNPSAATSYYPFIDQVGSVKTLTKADGTVAATYTYSAFGVVRATSGNISQPFQYAGGVADSSTGLVKFGIRYYDPTHGRFTQLDPTLQDPNPYSYALNDPITFSDAVGADPRTKALSGAEQQALEDEAAGRKADEKALKSAKQKQKYNEKYAGTRNKQKRQSNYSEVAEGVAAGAAVVGLGLLALLASPLAVATG